MTKLQIARSIVTNVVGISVGLTVGLALKALIPPAELKAHAKVRVWIGAAVLGEMVGSKASSFAGEQFDRLVEEFEKLKQKN